MGSASLSTRLGTPVRVVLDGVSRTGEFAGILDRTFGRVRIGHRVRFVALNDIEVLGPPAGALGDRWAGLHTGARS